MNNRAQPTLYPRVRMDALTDGIFAVAMTLLILDVRLPDDFQATDGSRLLHGLLGLWPKLLPYLLSFWLLGTRWLSMVKVRSRAEWFGGAYVRWWLLGLLLITCVPFTTSVIGRFASLPPAVWLYSGNNGLLAITSWFQLRLMPEADDDHHLRERRLSMVLLLASALLSIAWSFVDSEQALFAYLLSLAAPMLARRGTKPKAPGSA